MIDADEVRSRLSENDHRRIFKRCGFDLDGERGPEIDGVLGPKVLGEGTNGNFSVDLTEGLVKDWGSSGYQGDLFDVVQDTQRLEFSEALEWIVDACSLSVGGDTSPSSSPPSPPSPANTTGGPPSERSASETSDPVISHDQMEGWHERLMGEGEVPQAARSYLITQRGIAKDVLDAAQIGLAHSPSDNRAEWWIMVPVPDRASGDETPIVAVKGFAFDPETEEWKRDENGRKIPRNAGSAALYDLIPPAPFDGPVVVCEGELDALCALSNRFNAVTGTAGASTFKKEWASYLASLAPAQDHGVVVTFDGDEAGEEGAQQAAGLLHEAGIDVGVASLPSGADVNDILTEDGSDALRVHLEQAEPYEQPELEAVPSADEDEGAEYEPFPMDALPDPVRRYVRASARALGEGVPPAMVAVPTLSVLSGAVGDAAQIELKRSWTEPATLWTVLVAPSGSTKSPAFNHAVRPVFRRESEARDEHEQALADWKAQDDPDPQDRPTRKRFRTGDATPEAVVKILEENPRGVLLARDELGAWLGSFDRYVNGAADLQFWVEVWQGIQASRDRAGEGNTTVDMPAVPVTGTIQPGTLKEKLSEIHFDTGFAARLILCQPPTAPKRWTEADVSHGVRDAYERLLASLYGTPRGRTLPLSSGAKSLWVDYYNGANAGLETRPEGPAKAVAAKGITHTARLALLLHLCRGASGETGVNEVDKESMEAALQVGQWLTEETLRVYRKNGLGTEAKAPIRRFFDRLPDRFETSEAKTLAEEHEIPRRTLFDWLDRLQGSGDLKKEKRGHYRKT